MRRFDVSDALLGGGIVALGISAGVYFSPRARILRAARGELGETAWQKYLSGVADPPRGPIAWCGVFALWVLHKAGVLPGVRWEYGKGFLYRLPETTTPKPGDIAYIDQPYQHHAVVEKVEGDQITTIDGNSQGNAVRRNMRKRSTFSKFFRTI